MAVWAEAVPQQIRLGRDDRVRRSLEGGKRADQPEKQGAVIRRRETDFDPRRHRRHAVSRYRRSHAVG